MDMFNDSNYNYSRVPLIDKYCKRCGDDFFTEYEYNKYCDGCLDYIKDNYLNQVSFNINVICFDNQTVHMKIRPTTTTWSDIMFKLSEFISEDTHSIILNGRNKSNQMLVDENAYKDGLRNNDTLHLISNLPISLNILKLNGDLLMIDSFTHYHVCAVKRDIDAKYGIKEYQILLMLGEKKLEDDKTLFHYNISNDNNKLDLIVEEDRLNL